MPFISTIARLKNWAQKTPSAVAMVYGPNRYSYQMVLLLVHRLVKLWNLQGIQKGQLVALNIKDTALELMAALALESIGAIRISQLDDSQLMDRVDFLICDQEVRHCKSKIIFLNQKFLRSFSAVKPGDFEFEFEVRDFEPDEFIFLSSTSGTTGAKKYFYDTYRCFSANLELMEKLYFSGANTVFFNVYKLNVGAAYAGCCMALNTGGQIVFIGYADLPKQLELVSLSHAAIVLKDAQYFHDTNPDLKLKNKISTLRVLGAGLPLDLRRWLEHHLADQVVNSYSTNETGQIGEVMPTGLTNVYPSVQVRIVDEQWNILETEKQGFIAVNSAQLIPAYLWDEKLNETYFHKGWFRTNDLGYLKSEKVLVVLDRADNMVNVGGIKIPPGPIEAKLKELLGVEAVAMLNDPTRLHSDEVVVFIQSGLAAEFAPMRVAIGRFFGAAFPVRVVFLNTLPLTESGKIKKFELANLMRQAG